MNRNRMHFLIDILSYLALLGLAATGLIMAFQLPPGTGGRYGGGGGSGGALTLLGRSRHEWGDIHWYLALTFVVLMALHVALHWKWLTNTLGTLLSTRRPTRPGAGLGGTVALAAFGLLTAGVLAAPWVIGVKERQGDGGGSYRGGRGRRTEGAAAKAGTEQQAPKLGGKDLPASAAPGTATSAAEPGGHGKGRGRGGQGQAGQEHTIRGRNTLAEAAEAAGAPVARLLAELNLPPDTPSDTRLGHLRQEHGFTMEDVRAAIERLRKAAGSPERP